VREQAKKQQEQEEQEVAPARPWLCAAQKPGESLVPAEPHSTNFTQHPPISSLSLALSLALGYACEHDTRQPPRSYPRLEVHHAESQELPHA